MRTAKLRRCAALVAAAGLILLFSHVLLPQLAKAPCMEVVRSNLRHDIDATAYFYTELDSFSQYEHAVGEGARLDDPPASPAPAAEPENDGR